VLSVAKSPVTNVVHGCSLKIVKARENVGATLKRLVLEECFVAANTSMVCARSVAIRSSKGIVKRRG